MKFLVNRYDEDRHELVGFVDGKDIRCDPYVSCSISHNLTDKLIGRILLLPDDTQVTQAPQDCCPVLLPSVVKEIL